MMPSLISVVVPAYGVQSYLDECLDSALGQQFGDVEVIAVDDATHDHGGEVLAARAARESRLTVVHLDQNVGPGLARNVGLDLATGEYVWFVDGDDRLAPGALEAVADRLRNAGNPDLLIVGAARERYTRTVVRDGERSPESTTSVQPGVAAAVDRPLPPIGSLIIKREFLERSGIRLRPGWYEDISFYYEVFLAADTVATLDSACYIRRLDRDGSIRQVRSKRHAEVVDQYDHVLSLPAVAADPRQKNRLMRRAATHILTVYGDNRRVSDADRRDFFGRIAGLLRRHRNAGAAKPSGLAGLKQELAAHDLYLPYEVLRRLRPPAVQAATLLRLGAKVVRRWGLLLYYFLQRQLPLDDNLVVYAAYWYRGYACNPAAIYEGSKDLAPHLRGVWITGDPEATARTGAVDLPMPEGVDYVVDGTRAYFKLLARSKWQVNNVGFPEEFVKRRGQVQVQTHHGTPLKMMGYDQAKFPGSAASMDLPMVKRNCELWDYSITSNRHTTLLWGRQFPIPGETLEIGYPRNDVLATATAEDVARARESLGLAPGQRVVLYAPTHREWHPAFTSVLDVDQLAEELGPDTTILLRAHYFYSGTAMPPRHSRVVDVSGQPCVERLYLAADTLITDYSSVMFDYAVLNRPIVIFAPDWEIYRTVRGVTFDLAAEPPGVFTRSLPELVNAFSSGDVSGDQAAKARHQFRERFSYLDDGRATERLIRRVFLREPVAAGSHSSPRTNG